MNCTDFDNHFDAYVDSMLDEAALASARAHLAGCKACEHRVTDFQQTRCLLSTAVAEVAAAVDVSGFWERVASELGDPVPAREVLRPSFAERARDWFHDNIVPAFSLQGGALVTAGAAAAVVISLALPASVPVGGGTALEVARSTPVPASTAERSPLPTLAEGASVRLASSPVPARAERAPRDTAGGIDRLTAGPGRAVSTWVQPKTGARVIWVSDRDSASALVRTADYTR
jgi:anti-sigma factor RsiW